MRYLLLLSPGRLRLPIVAALLVGLLLAAMPARTVRAATAVCVDPTSFSCYNTIGEAVGVVSDGDTIFVHAGTGTYHEHDITIVTSVTITGSGGPILDAGGLGRGFIIQQGAAVTISGLTVQGGINGGIYNATGDLNLVNCLIRNNTGGGIANYASLALSGTTVSSNTTPFSGGGIFNQGGSTLTMDNSAIQNNTAYEGGGVYNLATVTMTNGSVVNYNRAQGGIGGGIENRHAHLAMKTGSAVLGNTATGDGGGVYNDVGSVMTLDNSAVGGLGSDGNTANGNGGGIFNAGGGNTVTIQNHGRVIGNTASGRGGGITNYGTVTLQDKSQVIANSAGNSGGGINNSGTVTVQGDSQVSGNTAHVGGAGIYTDSGLLTVTNSTISGNTAVSSFGGGVLNGAATNITSSTISGNAAAGGGGLFDGGSARMMVTNSTISGNTSTGGDGGVTAVNSGTVLVTSSTVTNNGSAGLFAGSGASITLKNSLIADSCLGTIVSGDYNLDSGSSCGFTQPHDLRNTNPLLVPLQVNAPGSTATHALRGGSPAVDRGGTSANGCPAIDQRGVSRPQGSACDIGAYELIPPNPAPPPRPGPVLGPPPPAPLPPGGRGMPASGGSPVPAPMPRR